MSVLPKELLLLFIKIYFQFDLNPQKVVDFNRLEWFSF